MRQFRLRIASVLMLLLGWTSLAGATDYYVDATNGTDRPGLGTMAEPWMTINYALDHINGSEATAHRVLVAQGIYVENVVCDNYESVYGGYSPGTWARDIELFSTTISGNNDGSCVVLAEGSTVDGFVLSNGNRDYGGGVRCEDINATISNCRITLNAAAAGSAIYVTGGFVQIQNNTITNNTGSAVYVTDAGAGFQNNVISDTLHRHVLLTPGHGVSSNNATISMSGDRILRNAGRGLSLYGGTFNAFRCIIGENAWIGVYDNGDATLIECVVHRNNINAGHYGDLNGGGIFTHGEALILERSIVCQNTAYRGGGLYKSGGTATIRDSILVANHSGLDQCCCLNSGGTTLKNNFIVNNGIIDIPGSFIFYPFISVNNSVLHNSAGYKSISHLKAGDITMTNDILWGNGDDLNLSNIDIQLISYCNIEDGDRNQEDNNISVIPDFIGQIGSGTFTGLDYKPQDCRTVITDSVANYAVNSLARCFMWVNDVAFYIESNTSDTLTVYGDVSQAASIGFSYTVQDYHLIQGSLCIDAGTGNGALDHDFEGDPRPINGGISLSVDMGADEYSDDPPPNDPPSLPTIVGTLAIAVTVPSVDPERRHVTYTVRWDSSSGETVVHRGCVAIRGTLCDVLTETELLTPDKAWTVTVTPNDGIQSGPAAVVEIGPCAMPAN